MSSIELLFRLMVAILISIILVAGAVLVKPDHTNQPTPLTRSSSISHINHVDITNHVQDKASEAKIQILAEFIKLRKSNTPASVAKTIAYQIYTLSGKHNLPYNLTTGICETESVWNIYAKSSKGAVGLMQIMNGGDISIDWSRAYDIDYNIDTGLRILQEHLRINQGDLAKALSGYSGGSKDYAKRVYTAMGRYDAFLITKSKLIKAAPNTKKEDRL